MNAPNTDIVPTGQTNMQLAIKKNVQKMVPEFARSLSSPEQAERFARAIQTSVALNPDLEKACETEGGMRSFLASCTKASQDGLILDGSEAALVTFNTKITEKGKKDRWEPRVQYMPMRNGKKKLIENSGKTESISIEVIYANDQFDYERGDKPYLHHKPVAFGQPRGEPLGAYAIAFLANGHKHFELMDSEEILNIGAQSKNAKQYDPGEGKNWREWWRKTLMHRLAKYIPTSSQSEPMKQAVKEIEGDFEFKEPAGPNNGDGEQRRERKGGAHALDQLQGKKEPNNDDIPDAEFTPADGPPDYDPNTGEVYGESLEDDVI